MDSKKSYHQQPSLNLATESHMLLIETSSEKKGFPVTNLIRDSNTLDYMSDLPLPQDIVIQLSPQDVIPSNQLISHEEMDKSSKNRIGSTLPTNKKQNNTNASEAILYNSINFVGWHCSDIHPNLSPKTVKVYISKYNAPILDPQFKYWATLRANKAVGTHLFKIRSVPKEYTRFKFEILENFSGKTVDDNEKLVCFNRIFLVTQDLNLEIENSTKSTNEEAQYEQNQKDQYIEHENFGDWNDNELIEDSKNIFQPLSNTLSNHFEDQMTQNSTIRTSHQNLAMTKNAIQLTELTDGLDTIRSRPEPRKKQELLSDKTNDESFEAEEKLNDASKQLESLQEDFSNILQTFNAREYKELKKQLINMKNELSQCQESIRHVKMFMNQISDRIQIIESEDFKTFILEQKRVNIGLNNQIGEFKKSFRNQTDEKLKKAFDLLEKKMEDRMRLMFNRHRDFTEKQIQKYLEKNLVNIRLKHPENDKIKAYNEKIQHVNKQQVKYNSKVYLDKDRPTKQHLQKKFFPEYFELEDAHIVPSTYNGESDNLFNDELNQNVESNRLDINFIESDSLFNKNEKANQRNAFNLDLKYDLEDDIIIKSSNTNKTPEIKTNQTEVKSRFENLQHFKDIDIPPIQRIGVPTPESKTIENNNSNIILKTTKSPSLSPSLEYKSKDFTQFINKTNTMKDNTTPLSGKSKINELKEKQSQSISRIIDSDKRLSISPSPKLKKWNDDHVNNLNEDISDGAEPLPNHLAEQLRLVIDQEQDIMEQLSASLKKYNFQF